MKRLIVIILSFLVVLILLPYIFQRDLKIEIANNYINTLNLEQRGDYKYLNEYQEYLQPWDTVFINFINDENINTTSLNIREENEYDVAIWNGIGDRNQSHKNATILIDAIQYGFYAEADVEIFAWEGSKDYKEKYICLFFIWFRLDQELVGMA